MIFHINSKKILFIHIPKCAGTLIETELNSMDMNPILLENDKLNEEKLWGQLKGAQLQHLTISEVVQREIALDEFDYIFTVIRDPVERFFSEFNWQLRNIHFQYDLSIKKVVEGFTSNDLNKFCHYKHQYLFFDGFEDKVDIFSINELEKLSSALSQVTDKNIKFNNVVNTSKKSLLKSDVTEKNLKIIKSVMQIDYQKLSPFLNLEL